MRTKNKYKDFFGRVVSQSPYVWFGCGGVVAALGVSTFLHPSGLGYTYAQPVHLSKLDPSIPASNYNRAWISDIKPLVVHIESMDKQGRGGVGSGIIIDSSGWILTCNHVVRGLKDVIVRMHDGREHKGKVTGSNDHQIDVALVKINVSGLQAIAFGDSDAVQVGDRVVAGGSPLRLEHSFAFGHISALNRENFTAGGGPGTNEFYIYGDVFQSDISANPGLSGSGLINEKRELIGMNAIIPGATNYSVGIGFALKSKFLKAATEILKKEGKFNRSYIGAGLENLKEFMARDKGIPGDALITSVVAKSPAGKGGLKKNDIIIKINQSLVKHHSDARLMLLSIAPKSKVKITVLRGDQEKTLHLTTATVPKERVERPQAAPRWNEPYDFFKRFFGPDPYQEAPEVDEESAEGPEDEEQESPKPVVGKPKLGATVVNLTKELREEYFIPETVKEGVMVKSVDSGSLAARAKLQEGDVILQVADKKIKNMDDLIKLLKKVKSGQQVKLRYGRYSENASTEVTLALKF